jgi:hypothetical protein
MHRICALVRVSMQLSGEKRGAIGLMHPNYASENKKNVRLDTVPGLFFSDMAPFL